MALRGFVRSLAKETGRRGSTVNLLEVANGGDSLIAGPLRFLLSDHAAFVTGQVLTVAEAPAGIALPKAYASPLKGRSVVVTGAARGIGAAIAQACIREGANVVGLDRVQEEAALGATMSRLGALGLALDITAPDAAKRITDEVGGRFGSVDVLIHNAGVTRDKTLKNMTAPLWDQVIDVNLAAIVNTTQKLLDLGTLREGARIVCISSINGIAGSPGQTNYAASKAGIIGYVEAMSRQIAGKGVAINAIAPGFIETGMTAAMPTLTREVGRRLSSLAQGGLPEDVAEAVVFFASPAAAGINGRYLRVCGQNFVGA
jgi:3-oxoacyl-[acyl-carrier protein] reductase